MAFEKHATTSTLESISKKDVLSKTEEVIEEQTDLEKKDSQENTDTKKEQ